MCLNPLRGFLNAATGELVAFTLPAVPHTLRPSLAAAACPFELTKTEAV